MRYNSVKIIVLKILKNRAIKSKTRKNLKNRVKTEKFSSLHIQKIGCVVDLEEITDVRFLEKLIQSYNVRTDSYIILGYKEQSTDTHIDGTPVFTWKDIDYSGRIRNYHSDRLSELEYDILINYFDIPKLPLLLLSSSIKAKLRIGFQGIEETYNDIIIGCKPSEKGIFIEEIKKIIHTIR